MRCHHVPRARSGWRSARARRRSGRAIASPSAPGRAPPSGAHVLVSRSHLDPATDAYVDGLPQAQRTACGSALKFCLIAEGSADIYPRLAPTSEWDVAAGHAVLAGAGGALRRPDGSPLFYGQGDFRIAAFIASGDEQAR